MALAAATSGSRHTASIGAGSSLPCSIITMGLDYRTCTYEPCRLEDKIRNVPVIPLAGDSKAPKTINPGSADGILAIYVVSGSCKISVAAQPILPLVIKEAPTPFDIQLNTRTPAGIGSTIVVAHPLPLVSQPADGAVHCFVFTATGGGAYVQMNIGSGWDYPLTPHGSGYYGNLSTVTVSLGENLNYTSGGTVYGFVRVDLYGLGGEPNPKHPDWNDFKSVKGSLSWAADARCQKPRSLQGAQHRMGTGLVRSARTVQE
eukprot:SAG22_NODE_1501_length_4280_cov_1.812963_2_plen_260_part_00